MRRLIAMMKLVRRSCFREPVTQKRKGQSQISSDITAADSPTPALMADGGLGVI